jgi:YHS domain-containing protein
METNGQLRKSVLCLIVLGIAAVVTGCGSSTSKQDRQKSTTAPASADDGHKDHGDATSADQSDIAAGLAKLSDADRALAEKQKTCPVSGESLGKHGKPVKVTVKGQTVFLCCAGCEAAIKKNPEKYLEKLKAKEGK